MQFTLRVEDDDTIFRVTPALNNPAIFLYDAQDVPLKVSGTFNFPAGKSSYRLVGNCATFQITSKPFEITGTGAAHAFTAMHFSDAGPTPHSPFKVEGDWHWTVMKDGIPGTAASAISSPATTTLELYFSLGDDGTPFGIFGQFFYELISISFPDYHTVAGQTWAAVEGGIIARIVSTLWTRRLYDLHNTMIYDCRFHGGGMAMHLHNATLNLAGIFSPGHLTVNCFDLAALTLVTLQSLGKRPGTTPGFQVPMIQGLKLVCDENWGYIPAGPLFGWDHFGAPARHCNNPFWIGRFISPTGDLVDAPPNVDRNDEHRTYFQRHCYCVFKPAAGGAGGPEHALDICHGGLNTSNDTTLASGNQDIANYRLANRETGRLNFPAITTRAVDCNWVSQ
ncbi:hypothetical protein B0T24DRAFT_711813 [Lasiosphaeria ovina]|uniref:Uncharacterized protein n=1 Tax=Lasiosphaeria ovina TaxID=92902 RepID=A0AAE0N100_9PEZI|nr:hypothetical protein B0T24DRAFT_711813 [Lasiosphaeria ovina]